MYVYVLYLISIFRQIFARLIWHAETVLKLRTAWTLLIREEWAMYVIVSVFNLQTIIEKLEFPGN
jgi:hypothetical protein